MSSIIPKGFNTTAHKVFSTYVPPVVVGNPLRQARVGVPASPAALVPQTSSNAKSLDLNAENVYECSVCLFAIDNPVTMISCLHSFCFVCISTWCERSNSCPLCKSSKTAFVCDNASVGEPHESYNVWRFVSTNVTVASKKRKYESSSVARAIKYHKDSFGKSRKSLSSCSQTHELCTS
jgi:hypothetical protein